MAAAAQIRQFLPLGVPREPFDGFEVGCSTWRAPQTPKTEVEQRATRYRMVPDEAARCMPCWALALKAGRTSPWFPALTAVRLLS